MNLLIIKDKKLYYNQIRVAKLRKKNKKKTVIEKKELANKQFYYFCSVVSSAKCRRLREYTGRQKRTLSRR